VTTVISAMSLMSPAGIGAGPFEEALRTGTRTPGGPVPGFTDVPSSRVRLADRPSAMALATIEALLADGVREGWPSSRRALVLGSGAAGIDQSMTLTRDSLTRPRPDNVNPALVPACVMNYASAQAAIRFGLRGPNATVTAGRLTGLAALGYARRLLDRDRADAVIWGAYEDLCDRRVAIAEAAGIIDPAAEACCAFLAEPARRARAVGRPVLAEVLALETGVFAELEDAAAVLRDAVDRALRRADAALDLLVPSGEEDLRAATRVVRPAAVVGDAFGAASALQVAAAIAMGAHGGLALVTSVDPDGHAGACLLRTFRPEPRSTSA
jgi:3-oxoacyl-[acyl-carrier-protein] synthase II